MSQNKPVRLVSCFVGVHHILALATGYTFNVPVDGIMNCMPPCPCAKLTGMVRICCCPAALVIGMVNICWAWPPGVLDGMVNNCWAAGNCKQSKSTIKLLLLLLFLIMHDLVN